MSNNCLTTIEGTMELFGYEIINENYSMQCQLAYWFWDKRDLRPQKELFMNQVCTSNPSFR